MSSYASHHALPSLSMTTRMHDPEADLSLPSPTASEAAALAPEPSIRTRLSRENILKPEYLKRNIITLVVIAVFVLLTIYQNKILQALQPAANWMRDTPEGWLIPIAILIVLSVPPLFGHEIILTLIGFTWGIGIGILIATAGTLIGELGTYYLCKYACAARGNKREQRDIKYASLSRVVRHGGWKIAIVVRYSALPSHFSTALFSACGMSVWIFLVSAVVSLPKQLATVVFGWALKQSNGAHNSTSKTVQWIIIIITTLVTILAMKYVQTRQATVVQEIVYERRKRRQELQHLGTTNPLDIYEVGTVYPLGDVYKP